MSEVIVKLTSDRIKVKGAEYVQDLVRCGECKHYEAKEDWCYWRDEAITADGFCSYGQKGDENVETD